MPSLTAEAPLTRTESTMRVGDVWAGPSGAKWLVISANSGRAHLRRHEPRSTKGARFLERPTLAPSTWQRISRGG
jgi:hypothetical protein